MHRRFEGNPVQRYYRSRERFVYIFRVCRYSGGSWALYGYRAVDPGVAGPRDKGPPRTRL